MKSILSNMDQRERLFLISGLAFLVIALLYGLVIEPFNKSLDRLRSEVPSKRLELAWIKQAAQEVAALRAAGNIRSKQTGEGPQLALIHKTARQFQLDNNLKKVTPGEQNKTNVWLENGVYYDIIQWINILEQKGFQITSFSADGLEDPGIVNARLTIKGESEKI